MEETLGIAEKLKIPGLSIASTKMLKARLLILMVLFFFLFLPLYPALLDAWLKDSNNSHGLLIPFASLYLVWKIRDKLNASDSCPSLIGLFVLLLGLLIYVLSLAVDLTFPARLSVVITLGGLILFNHGFHILRVVAFPLLFLLFMIPIPDSLLGLIAFPLQLIVSQVSAALIGLSGIPVLVEGNLLHFPRYSFEVTEACSGIRSLVSFIAIGIFLAHLEQRMITKAFLVLITVPLALLMNLIRVTMTGILASYFGPEVAEGFLHDFSGFLVFGGGIAMLIAGLTFINHVQKSSR